jgi:hypothetical protein
VTVSVASTRFTVSATGSTGTTAGAPAATAPVTERISSGGVNARAASCTSTIE